MNMLTKLSLCSLCADANYIEAECIVGTCGCSECERVVDDTRAIMPDDLFAQAVAQAKAMTH